MGVGSEAGLRRGSGEPLFLQWLTEGSRGRGVIALSLGYRRVRVKANSLFHFSVCTSPRVVV